MYTPYFATDLYYETSSTTSIDPKYHEIGQLPATKLHYTDSLRNTNLMNLLRLYIGKYTEDTFDCLLDNNENILLHTSFIDVSESGSKGT